jgi:hypothetical protein
MFSLHVFRRTALTGMIVLSMACTATAQTSPAESTTGLGESWPNAADVSTNPDWHAYVFQKDGVRYIQINDRNGTVHAAFGKAGEMVFALPVGVDAQRVDIVDALNPQERSETIYEGQTVTIETTVQNDGSKNIVAVSKGCDPINCTSAQMPIQ